MLIYNLAQIATKLSFLLQYHRIFVDKLTRKLCLGFFIFLVVWGIAQEILVGMVCNPVVAFIPSRSDKCVKSLVVWYLTSIMNIVTDFVVFTIPIPAIWKLQLRQKQKLLLASIFCLGFL